MPTEKTKKTRKRTSAPEPAQLEQPQPNQEQPNQEQPKQEKSAGRSGRGADSAMEHVIAQEKMRARKPDR